MTPFAVRTPEANDVPNTDDEAVAARPGDQRSFVTALARGLSVMTAFNGQNDAMTLSDVARRVNLPRATVRRCLLTLQALDYVESDGRYFSLSPQVLTLARAYLSSSILPRVAQPFLERVSEAIGESCSVSILHGAEVIYIARSSRRRMASLHRDVGTHLPAHCTSMGRVLLAALAPGELDRFFATAALDRFTPHTVTSEPALRAILAEIAAAGMCEVDQELEINLRSMAIPVRNAAGRVVAAMNVSTHAGRLEHDRMMAEYLAVMRAAAADMRSLLIG